MQKTIFLDRDGVLNEDPIGDYITKPKNFKLLPGVMKGLERLNWAGYRMIVLSNQAGIGDGVFTKKELEQVTDKFISLLRMGGIQLAGIYYCLHGKDEGCGCRKPRSGLFYQAALDFKIDKSTTYLIGDKLSDVEAAHEFGIKVVMVRTGHGRLEEKKICMTRPEFLVDDFLDAVDIVLDPRSQSCRK